jgi:uncharacterized repeat protein (TIGR01451 family)
VLGLVSVGVMAPTAQAAGSPFISFSPLLAGFGSTPAGASVSKTFTLKNSGKAATGALSIARTGSSAFVISADACSGVSLAAGQSCAVTIAYRPPTSGRIDVAVLSAHNPNFSAVAAAGLAGTSVAAKADLSITNTDGATSVSPGTTTTYTIVVSNNGPSSVTGASVADTVPAALSNAGWSTSSTTGATATPSFGSGNISGTVNLPAGSSITYKLTATVSSTATDSLTLANTASVTAPAGVTETNSANNSATDTDSIGAAVTCTTSCPTLTTGDPSTGQLTVNASGTGTATVQGAVFSGTLPCSYGSGDLQLDPNTYEVLSNSRTFNKTVTLEFPAGAGAPPIDSGDDDSDTGNDGDGDFDDVIFNEQVCFQAATGTTFIDRTGASVNVGLLPDCPDPATGATGPCVDRSASELTNVGEEGSTHYDIVIGVYIPAGTVGDPRMH